jgi:hypothetical protein
MPFIDVARAQFAYAPQSSDELQIAEDDLLYVLEKGDDDWWKVKKKVDGDDDGPAGLVPQNYLEQVPTAPSPCRQHDTPVPFRCLVRWLTVGGWRPLRSPRPAPSTTTPHRLKKSFPSPPMSPSISTTKTTPIGFSSDSHNKEDKSSTALSPPITSMMARLRVLRNYPLCCLLDGLIPLMSGDRLRLLCKTTRDQMNPLVRVMLYNPNPPFCVEVILIVVDDGLWTA